MDNVRQLSVWKSTSVDSIKYNADFFFFFSTGIHFWTILKSENKGQVSFSKVHKKTPQQYKL